jgi:hypothetical protein
VLSPLDDLPIHQTTEPVRVVFTSDRNFYDRYYFLAFSIDGRFVMTGGLGQYPNLGVTDAYVAVTLDGHQHVVRASRELELDRSDTTVGPISVQVLEGLKRLRLRVEPNEGEVDLDLEWSASIPAFLEARHVNRRGSRITTETSRFAQTGWWTGTARVRGEEFRIEPGAWRGGRDRSWGIRPVGEPEPVVRREGEGPGGFLWIYCQMQFESYSIICIVQENSQGARSLEQAVRVWRDPERGVDDLGSIHHDIEFHEGTRRIADLRLRFRDESGAEVVVGARPIGTSYLALGTGYGTEPEWRHGMYQGRLAVQHRSFDLSDPEVRRQAYGLLDDVGEFTCDGEVGYGLLENAVLGPNERYGLGRR